MKYPARQLLADETIVFDVHHHMTVLARSLSPALVFLAAWLACLFLFGFFRNGWVVLACALVFLALLGWFAYRLLLWSRSNFVLTDRRLIYQSGILSKRSREIPLPKITDVSLHQGVLDRMLGGGDLAVETTADSRPLPFVSMPRPLELKRAILEGVHSTPSGAPAAGDLESTVERAVARAQYTAELAALPPERPPLYSEIVDQIERLDAMRRSGAIDDEEFQAAKQGLLSRLSEEGPRE